MKNVLSSVTLRKKLFLAVRDVPYQIGNSSNDASCVAKTKLLGELLCRIGLDCQVWRAVVYWDQTGIPPSLLSLTSKTNVSHLFLKVYIPETQKWVTVDPTWDKRFAGKLPINAWEGLSNTTLAFPSNQLRFVGSVSGFSFRNFNPSDAFTKALNKWYQSLAERKSC